MPPPFPNEPTTTMRTRLPVFLLIILVVLLFVNLGKALQHDHLETAAADDAASAAVATRSSDATRYSLKDAAGASSKDASRDGDGERLIDRTFDVSSGDDLSVRVDHADVEVVTGASDQARVEVFLDARDMERARRYFEDLRFEVEQRDNTVSVTTNRRPGMNWSSARSGGARITVRIAVPEAFDADLRLSHGDLDLGALTGRTSVQASHGDVETASLRGPALSFELSHGDLDADRLEAEAIRLRTSHGDLDLGTVVAGRRPLQQALLLRCRSAHSVLSSRDRRQGAHVPDDGDLLRLVRCHRSRARPGRAERDDAGGRARTRLRHVVRGGSDAADAARAQHVRALHRSRQSDVQCDLPAHRLSAADERVGQARHRTARP